MRKITYTLFLALGITSLPVVADIAGAQQLAIKYGAFAKNIDPASKGLSADAGRAFYIREITIKGKQVSCSSCHTDNPAGTGKHMVTKKNILPLAPAANAKRFSNLDKVEKNFKKHCEDILGRDCTAQEKGDVITYLLSVK